MFSLVEKKFPGINHEHTMMLGINNNPIQDDLTLVAYFEMIKSFDPLITEYAEVCIMDTGEIRLMV